VGGIGRTRRARPTCGKGRAGLERAFLDEAPPVLPVALPEAPPPPLPQLATVEAPPPVLATAAAAVQAVVFSWKSKMSQT